MKILIVHPQMALYGGAELVVIKLAKYLQEHEHDVTIMTLSTDGHKDYKGIKFILPPKDKQISYRLRGGIGSISDILRIQSILHKLCHEHSGKFDVINVHNFPAIWSIPEKKRIVWMCNEVPDLWHNAKVNGLSNKLFNIARQIDKSIVKSKKPVAVVADTRCADVFHDRYGFTPEIIHYGVDGNFFGQHYHDPRDTIFRIICTSMISPSKNQLEILKAVNEIKYKIPNIKVTLSGYKEPEHPYSKLLEKYIEVHALNVTYVPPIDRDKLCDIYGESTVAVFAGKGQGSWLSPFEQLSLGIPVIVTPDLTCSDLIQEKKIGTVTNDIASTLVRVYENYTWFKNQAIKGRKFVLSELTWDNFGNKMETLLKESYAKKI